MGIEGCSAAIDQNKSSADPYKETWRASELQKVFFFALFYVLLEPFSYLIRVNLAPVKPYPGMNTR